MNIRASINTFFSKGHERTLRAKKNIAITFLIKGFSILIGLILISITINYVNPTQYGIWLTLSSIISWFSYFDIGLGNGLKNKLAETNALNQHELSKIYVSTTYAILTIISGVIFLLFFVANHFLNWNSILNTSNDAGGTLNSAALLLIAIFCTQFIVQLINIVLTACHVVSKVSLINLIGQAASLVIIYVLTKHTTGTLFILIAVVAGVPLLIQFLFSIWYYSTEFKAFAPSLKSVKFKYASNLLTIGGVFFFIQIGSLILFQTDNIIIAQLFHPPEVTVFNLAFRLFSVITMIFTIIMTPFWSAFTDAYTKGDIEWISTTIVKMRKLWVYLCVCSVALLILSPLLYKIWLHGSVQIPFVLSFAMCFYVMGYSWIMLHCYLLNGIGKIRLQLYMYMCSIFINVPMAIYSGKLFGVAGVTFSNFLIFVIMGILLWVQCRKILNGTASGVWNK